MPASKAKPYGVGNEPSVNDGRTTQQILTPVSATVGTFDPQSPDLSFEMQDDAPYVCVPTKLHHLALAERRLLAALRFHTSHIVAAETQFQVDRRAIAGAIAWEALENNSFMVNVLHRLGLGRPEGWGKEHLRLNFVALWEGGKGTWAQAVEERGLLSSHTDAERKTLLARPDNAIDYVAASMDLIALIYEEENSPGICHPPLRLNPAILTYAFNAKDPVTWRQKVKEMTPDHILEPGKDKMSHWMTNKKNIDFLEDAVGTPPAELKPGADRAGQNPHRDSK